MTAQTLERCSFERRVELRAAADGSTSPGTLVGYGAVFNQVSRDLGGWAEEVWYALYQAAVLAERLQHPAPEVQAAYLAAYQDRPTRAEPLYELARYLRCIDAPAIAYLYALRAAAMPKPADLLFVDAAVYEWKALDELGSTAWYARAMDDGRRACERLLAENRFEPEHRKRIEDNLRTYAA